MVKAPLTLWECLERAPRPVPGMSLKVYLVTRLYPRGWSIYHRASLNDRWSCSETLVANATKRGRGRLSREEKAEMNMVDAVRSGVAIRDVRNDMYSDMLIADAYLLIVKCWGFPRRDAAEALGEAAAALLGRTCPHGKPLGGDRIKQLAEDSPLIRFGAYRSRQSAREDVVRFRPKAFQGKTPPDLKEVCHRVLECGGRTPPEWEDVVIFSQVVLG